MPPARLIGLLALLAPLLCAGCLDDLEPQPPETICTFSRTPFQREVLERLGVDDAEVGGRRCREPEEYTIASPFPGVPDADIEPAVNIIRVEVLREVRSDIDEGAYPCGAGGEPIGELAICGDFAGPVPPGNLIVTFETDEPLPLADPDDHLLIGFGFDSDGIFENNTTPENAVDDFHLRIDRWVEISYHPGEGWSLAAYAQTVEGPLRLSTAMSLIIDGPVVALLAPLVEFAVVTPQTRVFLLRHTGDFGREPPHDWSGFVFPSLSESLF